MAIKGGRRSWAQRVALAAIVLIFIAPAEARAANAGQSGCYAEVLYLDHPYGHTYEYLCGRLRLHAGELVRVPVRNGVIDE